MKKLLLFIALQSNAQSKEGTYLKVLDSLALVKLDKGYAIYINDSKTNDDDMFWVNLLKEKDVVKFDMLTKEKAITRFGKDGEKGAVVLTPFVDDLLTAKYYEGITNKMILEKIATVKGTSYINQSPLLVLDGIPLRGKDIAGQINALSEEKIKSVIEIPRHKGVAIFGIRAVSGVLIITTVK